MAEEHDSWLAGIGVDVDGVLAAVGNAAAPMQNPDAAQRAIGLDQAADFASGFAKGVADVGIGVAQSGGAMTNPFGQLANLTAAAAGVPGADKSLLPDLSPDLSKKNQQQAAAKAQGIVDTLENPIGSAADAGVKIATSDHPAELIGEGLGKGLAIAGATLAGSGEAAAAGEDAGVAGAATEDPALAQTQLPSPNAAANSPAAAGSEAAAGVPPTLDGVPPTIDGVPPTIDDPVLAKVPEQQSPRARSLAEPASAADPVAAPPGPPAPAVPPAPDSASGDSLPFEKESPLAASIPDP